MRLILLAALLAASCSNKTDAVIPDAIVAKGRAIDGDTISLDLRLLGADSFERKQMCRSRSGCWPCGKAAQNFTSKLLKGKQATIRMTGKESYGRPIATVEVDGRDLGETIIAAGYAVPAVTYLKADPGRAKRYLAAYQTASSRHAGAHGGFFIDPAKWRKGERLMCEARPNARRNN